MNDKSILHCRTTNGLYFRRVILKPLEIRKYGNAIYYLNPCRFECDFPEAQIRKQSIFNNYSRFYRC